MNPIKEPGFTCAGCSDRAVKVYQDPYGETGRLICAYCLQKAQGARAKLEITNRMVTNR